MPARCVLVASDLSGLGDAVPRAVPPPYTVTLPSLDSTMASLSPRVPISVCDSGRTHQYIHRPSSLADLTVGNIVGALPDMRRERDLWIALAGVAALIGADKLGARMSVALRDGRLRHLLRDEARRLEAWRRGAVDRGGMPDCPETERLVGQDWAPSDERAGLLCGTGALVMVVSGGPCDEVRVGKEHAYSLREHVATRLARVVAAALSGEAFQRVASRWWMLERLLSRAQLAATVTETSVVDRSGEGLLADLRGAESPRTSLVYQLSAALAPKGHADAMLMLDGVLARGDKGQADLLLLRAICDDTGASIAVGTEGEVPEPRTEDRVILHASPVRAREAIPRGGLDWLPLEDGDTLPVASGAWLAACKFVG